MSTSGELPDLPVPGTAGKATRGALQVLGGAIPLLGGVLSAAAGAWSEQEQERVNRVFEHWIRMLHEELREKERTLAEIMARLNMSDPQVINRVESADYQALLRKAFRDWAGSDTEEKRILVRNLLSNAAAATLTSDDVVRLFIEWIRNYSPLHFAVIKGIYNNAGITRGELWEQLGKRPVREDSAEADLYKLLFRDLSTGSVIRQHRETDGHGNFRPKPRRPRGTALKSAFDDDEPYELTALGQQFVHYAMTEVPPKIDLSP